MPLESAKSYNDNYGHLKGDQILKQLIATLQHVLPQDAFLARYGGEEFAIVAHVLDLNDAQAFAESCLQAIRDLQLAHAYRQDQKNYVSISIGGALLVQPTAKVDLYEWMKIADQQLYVAKLQRDRAVVIDCLAYVQQDDSH